MRFLMSSGNILSLLDFRVLGGMVQIISFKPFNNGCSSYFSPDTRWSCEQVVSEDMNDIRYVAVSGLLSVEGNNGSVVEFSVFGNSERNTPDFQKSVPWSNLLMVFDA